MPRLSVLRSPKLATGLPTSTVAGSFQSVQQCPQHGGDRGLAVRAAHRDRFAVRGQRAQRLRVVDERQAGLPRRAQLRMAVGVVGCREDDEIGTAHVVGVEPEHRHTDPLQDRRGEERFVDVGTGDDRATRVQHFGKRRHSLSGNADQMHREPTDTAERGGDGFVRGRSAPLSGLGPLQLIS